MKSSFFRPRFVQVIARQWLNHGDHQLVRHLTWWERMTHRPSKTSHSTTDLGMLVLGEQNTLVNPGDWILHEGEDLMRVVTNEDFCRQFVPTSLDPSLQEIVNRLEEFKEKLGDKSDTIALIDSAVTGLYMQAEVVAKCYQEKYEFDTRFLPRNGNGNGH